MIDFLDTIGDAFPVIIVVPLFLDFFVSFSLLFHPGIVLEIVDPFTAVIGQFF